MSYVRVFGVFGVKQEDSIGRGVFTSYESRVRPFIFRSFIRIFKSCISRILSVSCFPSCHLLLGIVEHNSLVRFIFSNLLAAHYQFPSLPILSLSPYRRNERKFPMYSLIIFLSRSLKQSLSLPDIEIWRGAHLNGLVMKALSKPCTGALARWRFWTNCSTNST